MARVTVEDCLDNVDNRFELVMLATKRSRQLAIVLEAVALTERDVPDYLEVDHNKMTATFVRTPALGDIPYAVQMEPNLVVEFYAKN